MKIRPVGAELLRGDGQTDMTLIEILQTRQNKIQHFVYTYMFTCSIKVPR